MTDFNYENALYLAYTKSYQSVPQESRNCFDGTMGTVTLEGKEMAFNDIGTRTMRKKTNRFSHVKYTNTTHRRRWLYPEWYYDAWRFDKEDDIALIATPTSAEMMEMTKAIERQKRDVIITAFDATVRGGELPNDTSYSFTNTAIYNATGRTIVHDTGRDGAAGGTSAGLTVEKLILIQEKFATLGIPEGTPIKLVTSFRQRSDLLREAETQGTDTSEVKALVAGTINNYMGIDFIRTNAITLGSSNDIDSDTNVYECFAWIPEGMKFATNLAPSFKQNDLPDLEGDVIQVKVSFGCNAIRMHEDLVLKVECAAVNE